VASSINVDVLSTVTWTVSSDVAWIRFDNITPANRTGNGSFRINAEHNNGSTSRRGTITVTAPGAPTQRIDVYQAAITRTLTLSESTWNPSSIGGVWDITVTAQPSSLQWSILVENDTDRYGQRWLSVHGITPANRTGNGSFAISVQPNTGNTSRTGIIRVSADGAPIRTVTVQQDAALPVLNLSTQTWNPASSESFTTVNIESNRQWEITSNSQWLAVYHVSPANRTGNGHIILRAATNPETQTRNGTITVTTGNITRTIQVNQGAQHAPTLSLSRGGLPKTEWAPAHMSAFVDVNVASNRQWSIHVPADAQHWLNVRDITPVNQVNNGSFRLQVNSQYRQYRKNSQNNRYC